jgi:hypothetical protein
MISGRYTNDLLNKVRIVFLITGCFLSPDILAQQITATAELDTNRALIGDQIGLTIRVEKPDDWQIFFPEFKDTLGSKVEIISQSPTDTLQTHKGSSLLSRYLLISVFDTGVFEIPSLTFIGSKDQFSDTAKTNSLAFEIFPVKTDTVLHDIKAIAKAPFGLKELFYYTRKNAFYILGTVFLGFMIWYLIRFFRKRRAADVRGLNGKPVEPPEVIALRGLEKLKDEKPWLKGRVKMYYVDLSEILRRYIEDRYEIMAMEQTTDEIMSVLKSPVCNTAHHALLAGILQLADLVKFAKVVPGERESATQVELAIEFVRNTRQVHGEVANDEGQSPNNHQMNPGHD